MNLLPDPRYGQEWEKSSGRIVLQEHDNKVQFRNIEINPAWVPTIGGGANDPFDDEWQQE